MSDEVFAAYEQLRADIFKKMFEELEMRNPEEVVLTKYKERMAIAKRAYALVQYKT